MNNTTGKMYCLNLAKLKVSDDVFWSSLFIGKNVQRNFDEFNKT